MEKGNQAFNEFNKRMRLNDQPPASREEFDDLENFNKAYNLEIAYRNRDRKRKGIVLIVVLTFTTLFALLGGMDYVAELIIETFGK